MTYPAIEIQALDKRFTLHTQGGVELPVLRGVSLSVRPGECVVLRGPSGVGKSTLLRCVYGNYVSQAGRIFVRKGDLEFDMADATPREILALRRDTVGYVTQFLRVIPRVSTLDVVSEPLRALGVDREQASRRAAELLARVRIPDRLWELAPATFSGGEQQRVNIARGFVVNYPILLLDEPTAALDAANRDTVVDLIREATERGTAILGIFHDDGVRDTVATRIVDLEGIKEAA